MAPPDQQYYLTQMYVLCDSLSMTDVWLYEPNRVCSEGGSQLTSGLCKLLDINLVVRLAWIGSCIDQFNSLKLKAPDADAWYAKPTT